MDPPAASARRIRTSLLALALLGVTGGCGASSGGGVSGAGEGAVVVKVPVAPAEVAPVEPAPPDVRSYVCGGNEKCSIFREHDAGQDEAGRTLSVVLAFVGARSDTGEDIDPEIEKDASTVGYVESSESFDHISPRTLGDGICLMFEYWLVEREDDVIKDARRIRELCNDGHGSDAGDDSFRIDDNLFEHEMTGGVTLGWSETITWSLSPWRETRFSNAYRHATQPNTEANECTWATFDNETRWYSPACDEDGNPPPYDVDSGDPPMFGFVRIPLVPLSPAFVAGEWKTTDLWTCAARVEATAESGYVLTGKPSTALDATFRVVAASPGDLFIEVTDDKLVGPTARPATDDHLEIWVSNELPTHDTACLGKDVDTGISSWDVRVADGKVTAGFGKPSAKALSVERVADPSGVVRLHVVAPVPSVRSGLTVVYADNDGTGKIVRRTATSKLEKGKGATLGSFMNIADRAQCKLVSGSLVLEVRPP